MHGSLTRSLHTGDSPRGGLPAGVSGVLVVDKPAGITSADVLRRLKRKTCPVRMGHTGTLDPLATGVLPICLGEATKLLNFMELEPKKYLGTLRLGLETDTWDITGNVIREEPHVDCPGSSISDVLSALNGRLFLLPPMFSAIKHKGKPLYHYARQGRYVEAAPREVFIDSFELLEKNGRDLVFQLMCSRGTYVRSVVHEIGARLGCGACLVSLRRLRCGRFTIETALSLDEMENIIECGRAGEVLIQAEETIRRLDTCSVDGDNEKRIRHGSPLREAVVNDVRFATERIGERIAVLREGLLIAIAEIRQDDSGFFLQPVRVLNREEPVRFSPLALGKRRSASS